MKILFSINYKFYDETPISFIKFIKENDKNKIVNGFEAAFDINNQQQINYINELAFLCLKNDFHLQFHGNSDYDLETQKRYMDFLNEISNILDRKIFVVLHPQTKDNLENSIEKSNIYFSEILNYIYERKYNIRVSVENLNSIPNIVRLSKEYLKPILANNMDLCFTYDMGHEIIEYGKVIDLDAILLERLSNVHIHTFDYTFDHQPILDNDINKEKWIKSLQYLNLINFNNTIVLEYDFYELGNTYYERLLNYIENAYLIFEYVGGSL